VSVSPSLLAIEFPPISHLIEWPNFIGGDSPFAVNKIVLLLLISMLITIIFYVVASRPRRLVPKGAQNLAESVIDFIQNDIIMQTMGKDGLGWTPFLLTLFSFIFVCNIWEVIPAVQMPVTARIALPMFLAVMVWLLYWVVGFKYQGFGYLKNSLFPPGVPWFLYILVTPIELAQILIVRPLSLALRLFANMLAGHLLLVTFAVLSASMWAVPYFLASLLPASLLVALTGFEILVAVLQAFIFTILTAVYIGGSMHPEH
jgi:F-type H+-transporting ATPase subunit a